MLSAWLRLVGLVAVAVMEGWGCRMIWSVCGRMLLGESVEKGGEGGV